MNKKNEFFNFATEHPFLTLFGLDVICTAAVNIVDVIVNGIVTVINKPKMDNLDLNDIFSDDD